MEPDTGRPVPPQTFDSKTAHVLVRWLIIALAFHFIALSGVREEEFSIAVRINYVFIVSNLLLMAFPGQWFASGTFLGWLMTFDLGFLSVCFYWLREPGAYYHWIYILLLAFLVWKRNLKQVLIALVAGLALSGVAAGVSQREWRLFADAGDFLRSGIVFAMAGFYFFVVDLIHRSARLFQIVSRGKQEWERTADAMNELILVLDENGWIRRVNRPLADRLRLKPDQLVGQQWHIVLEGSEMVADESPLARMLQDRKPASGRVTHAMLGCETQGSAIPLLDGETLVGAIYVLRPLP